MSKRGRRTLGAQITVRLEPKFAERLRAMAGDSYRCSCCAGLLEQPLTRFGDAAMPTGSGRKGQPLFGFGDGNGVVGSHAATTSPTPIVPVTT